jgi:hypothetical protein
MHAYGQVMKCLASAWRCQIDRLAAGVTLVVLVAALQQLGCCQLGRSSRDVASAGQHEGRMVPILQEEYIHVKLHLSRV